MLRTAGDTEVIVMEGRRIDLARARREARALLGAARAGDAVALERLRAAGADRAAGAAVRLADAQLAVARELGDRSWPALVRRAEAEAVARDERAHRFVTEATTGRRDRADALLGLDPALARAGLDAALVLGDVERVRRALGAGGDAARGTGRASALLAVDRPLGVRGWVPLLYVAHSAYLGGERTEGLLACARALLAAGADATATWQHPEFGALSALYGAAGVAHEPRMTALLLEAGADPDDGESLYHATEAADHACVELLLAAGATVDGTHAPGHALDREDPELLERLLARAAEQGAGPGQLRGLVTGALWRGRSARVLETLLAHGGDPEEADGESGRRAHALAVHLGRPDLAAVLAAHGARAEAAPIDELVGACLRGDAAAAERLLAADPNLRDTLVAEHGEMLVHAAAGADGAAVGLLHDLGVPLSTRGQLSGTALHHAAWNGWVDMTEELIARGADVHAPAPDTGSATPLDWAVHGSVHAPPAPGRDHRVLAQRLVEAGARVEPRMAEDAAGSLAAWLRDLPDDREPPVRLQKDDPHGWGEHAWAAQAAYLRALAGLPEVATRTVGDGFAVRTGADSNAENGVVCSAATPQEIAAALAFLDGASAQWLTADTGITERLVAAGCHPERSAFVMGAEVAALAGAAPPPGIAIAAIDDLDTWLAAAAQTGWAGGPALPAPGLRPFLATRDGQPVGVAITFAAGEVVELRELHVRSQDRRQGIGRALALHALAAARPQARVAVLAATRSSQAFHARLGFALAPCPPDRVFYVLP